MLIVSAAAAYLMLIQWVKEVNGMCEKGLYLNTIRPGCLYHQCCLKKRKSKLSGKHMYLTFIMQCIFLLKEHERIKWHKRQITYS